MFFLYNSLKDKFAEWLTNRDNPFFARAAVNRIWAQFLGRGLIHPIDDIRPSNAPSIPGLLEEATQQFIKHNFDVQWLIRELVSSETYALDFRGGREALPRWHERGRVRPLSAEEFLSSARVATGYDQSGGKLPAGTVDYFVRYLGEPTNGQGEFQGSLSEHLFLNNSSHARELLRQRKGNLTDFLIHSKETPAKRVEHLFLAVLTRKPTPAEVSKFAQVLQTAPQGASKNEGIIEDAIWALLNSAEFRFQH